MPSGAQQILCVTVLALVEDLHFIRLQHGPKTVGIVVDVTVTLIILANDAVVDRNCTRFSKEFEQV